MESILLIGAEQVQSAGRNMSGAADQMSQAVTNLDGALERHQRFLDDWLQRFEGVMFAHARMMGEEPPPQQEAPVEPQIAIEPEAPPMQCKLSRWCDAPPGHYGLCNENHLPF